MAYALAGFATDATHVSSSGTAAAKLGIANAFINAAILETLRRETEARFALTRQILEGHDYVGRPDAFHVWLPLPAGWSRGAFTARLGARGVGVVMSDAFCTTPEPPEAVRISLGAPETRADLAVALRQIRDLLDQDPAWGGTV